MRLVLDLDGVELGFDRQGSTGPYPWLVSVGVLRLSARAGTVSGLGRNQTPDLTVVLDNQAKQAVSLVGYPLRRRAWVLDSEGELFFAGTVARVGAGRNLRLTLEAGGALRLFAEPLPLRTTRMLGDFASDLPLPHRWGDLTGARFSLIRLSATRYFVADHYMTLSKVFVDDERTDSWAADVERDDQGNVWTVVNFAAEVDQDARVSATGKGKLNPVTGALIENPGEIMEDILSIAGIPGSFPDLRAQAAAEGLRFAGSVTSMDPVQSVLDAIAMSAAAMWTPSTSRLYPSTSPTPVFELDPAVAGGFSDLEADLEDTADILRIRYAPAEATGKAQRHIELSASPALYGGIARELDLPWLQVPANAEAVGKRILSRMAGRKGVTSFTVERNDIRPGHDVRPLHNPEWYGSETDPVVTILGVEVSPDLGATELTGEVLLSTPTIEVTGHSLALLDTSEGGVDFSFKDGILAFTVKEKGRPIYRAKVTLDARETRYTDDQGRVSFRTTTGPHELLIEREGYGSQQVSFNL